MFGQEDIRQICEHGLTREEVELQLKNFTEGFPFLKLARAASIQDGIIHLEEPEIEKLGLQYEKQLKNGLIPLKFVPASGAATRMFRMLYRFREEYKNEQQAAELLKQPTFANVRRFFETLSHFAFYGDLSAALQKDGINIQKASMTDIIDYLISPKGLNYGNMPKGLLKFHQYDSVTKTPLEEHLEEACLYACPADRIIRMHLTVSPQHKNDFSNKVESLREEFEQKFNVHLLISFSEQKQSTDAIAVNPDNTPFRDSDNHLLFRPAGHGSLLENMNALNADLIFIKNIDNITLGPLRNPTIQYKKALAGLLLRIRKQLYRYQQILDTSPEDLDESLLSEMSAFLKNTMNVTPPEQRKVVTQTERIAYLKEKINRPLRVCGMVRNEGDPGGGPFWVINNDGSISLQIVENSQIDKTNEQQHSIASHAGYFNPVDLVCSIRNYQGKKYQLNRFVNPNAGFISEKSHNGKTIKVQERPGLWNGSMAEWNTIFVEVPGSTFTPVKTIFDLLKQEHRYKHCSIALS